MNDKVYIGNMVLLRHEIDHTIVSDSRIDHIGFLCIEAINQLLADRRDLNHDVPIFFGSAFSSLKSLQDFNIVCEEQGALRVNPSLFPNTVLNSPSCQAGIYHHITSPIFNISNGTDSACSALELAYMYVSNGEIDSAIVCIADESSELANEVTKHEIEDYCGAIYLTKKVTAVEISAFEKNISINTNNNDYDRNVQLLVQINNFIHSLEQRKEIEMACDGGMTVNIILSKEQEND